MGRKLASAFLFGAIACSLQIGQAKEARACSCFAIVREDARLVGKNYDWAVGDGLVMANPRGLAKVIDPAPGSDGRRWIAEYGSVTFNQYGRDVPQGGINEAGLVIEILWLASTVYPPTDQRRALGSAQWIQYELDTASSVAEVIASLDSVRVQSRVTVHYFVADREGRWATVEYIDGKGVLHTDASLPAPVLTNSTYDESLAHLIRCQGWGGDAPLGQSRSSLDRFARAAAGVRELQAATAADPAQAFAILAEVAQGSATQWSIVYDLLRMRVLFRSRQSPTIKTIDLAGLEFDCHEPVRILDLNGDFSGPLAEYWRPYSLQANRDLIGRSFAETSFLKQIPDEALDRIAAYPEFSTCLD